MRRHAPAVDSLQLLDPASGRSGLGLGWTSYVATALASSGGRVVFAAGSPTQATALVALDVATGREEVLRRSLDIDLDPAIISVPVAIEFPTGDGPVAHAFYYPPRAPTRRGRPRGAAAARHLPRRADRARSPHFDLETHYFTQRGIGVVDVNYRGSTGYGREYRRLLNGRWGEIDWDDCVSAASTRGGGRGRPRSALGGGRERGRLRRLLRARLRPEGSRPASATSASPTRRRSRSTRTSSSPATSTR